MQRLIFAMAVVLGACASSDPAADYARFESAMHVRTDPDGARVASSAPANEAKNLNLYSGGEALAMWVMVHNPPQGETRVVLAGSRARAIPHEDVKPTDPEGPGVRAEPAYVGNPWQPVDFAYTERSTECYGASFWCNRLQQFELTLSGETVRAFIAEDAPESIPIALFTRRDVDWRIQRAELLATLEAAGAADQFR